MGTRVGWRALTVTVVVIRVAGMLWCLAAIVFAVWLTVSGPSRGAELNKPFVVLMVSGLFGWVALLLATILWKMSTRTQLADEDIDPGSALANPGLNGYLSDFVFLAGVAGFILWVGYLRAGSGPVWMLGVLIVGVLVAGAALAAPRGDLRRARTVLWDLPAPPKVDPFRWPSD
jgi:hypothetical protein